MGGNDIRRGSALVLYFVWEMLCLYMYGEVVGMEVNIVASRFDDINEQLGIKERVATNNYYYFNNHLLTSGD